MTLLRRIESLLLPAGAIMLLLPLPAAASGAQSSYGFVARLGHDTVFVERIHRTADHLSGDVIERHPIVMIRHYDAELAPDGTVRRFVVDSRSANAGASPPEHVELEYAGDSLRVSGDAGAGSSGPVIATRGMLAMPWFRSAYGTSEQLLLAAGRRSGDSMMVATYTPAGTLRGAGSTVVRRFHDDSASLDYRGLPIVARFDRQGRIAAFSGERTTNKEAVARVDTAPDIDAIAATFSAEERAAGGRPSALSPRDTARGRIGSAVLLIDYGSPRLRGRQAIGRLVPLDTVWRTGADEATQFETSAPIRIAGMAIAPGRYTLWTLLGTHGPMLIINRQTGQWGTDYDLTHDMARAPLASVLLSAPIEAFTIRIARTGPSTGILVMEWDHFRWTAPITAR